MNSLIKGCLGKIFVMRTRAHWKIKEALGNSRGMGTIEVVLIVAVLVALALLFKTFITRYANNIFDKIDSTTEEALESW